MHSNARIALEALLAPSARLSVLLFLSACTAGTLPGPVGTGDPCTSGLTYSCECPGGSGITHCDSGLIGDCLCLPFEEPEPSPEEEPSSPGEDSPDEETPGEEKPLPEEEITEPGVAPSGAPVGLLAVALGPTRVELVWRPLPEAGVLYRVYRDGAFVAATAEPQLVESDLQPGRRYSYSVSASTSGGESSPSSPVQVDTHQPDADGELKPDLLEAYSTHHSIGFEWKLSGDANNNASATLRYRALGDLVWREGQPLMRIAYEGQNMLAGSLLFLQPGTSYDVLLYARDPDGGQRTELMRVATRAIPALPKERTFHVVPGSGGGEGSASNPFKGIAAAQAQARPGDLFLLHGGHYGGRIGFSVAGSPGKPVAWKAFGDGAPVFAGVEVRASHVHLEGLRIEAGGGYDFPIGLRTANGPKNVAVVGCTVVGNHYGIWLNSGGESDWYIADNTIVGTNSVSSGSFSGEGVELNKSAGHTVAHNRISLVGDGVSYCRRNCDIFGNDIFDTSDDGIEPDSGFANIRMWGNRLHNTGHNGVSFQPMSGGPWYLIRNQIIGNSEAILKFRGSDRFVFAHNTVVGWTNVQTIQSHELLKAFSRNNIWISVQGGTLWHLGSNAPDWRTSLDYDGFDWGSSSSPFRFGGQTYKDLASFSAASGLEKHGVALSRGCFPTLKVPGAPPASVPPQVLTLSQSCPAIDAGQVLANINEGYEGSAPDLGAFESGKPAPHYGPRI